MKNGCLLIACFVTFGPGCGSDGSGKGPSKPEGATETNVVPAPCTVDEECPDGVECILENGSDDTGHCGVAETSGGTSSSTPAPCTSNDECPEGIECLRLDEGSPGFCSVDETVERPDGSADTLSVPAPCTSNDECPNGIECVRFDEGSPGYCNVDEAIEG